MAWFILLRYRVTLFRPRRPTFFVISSNAKRSCVVFSGHGQSKKCYLGLDHAYKRRFFVASSTGIAPQPYPPPSTYRQETTQPLVLQGVVKWRISGSNRRPFECHSNALPTELIPHRKRLAATTCQNHYSSLRMPRQASKLSARRAVCQQGIGQNPAAAQKYLRLESLTQIDAFSPVHGQIPCYGVAAIFSLYTPPRISVSSR